MSAEDKVEGAKYPVWGRTLQNVRGLVFQGIDTVQQVPYLMAGQNMRIMSEYSRQPRLYILLTAIRGMTDYYSSAAAKGQHRRDCLDRGMQWFKEEEDALGAYGKFYQRTIGMLEDEAIQTDLVSEDLMTALQELSAGKLTKFIDWDLDPAIRDITGNRADPLEVRAHPMTRGTRKRPASGAPSGALRNASSTARQGRN